MKNGIVISKRAKLETNFLYLVFFFYILFLAKLLLFSRVSISGLFDAQRTIRRSFNFVPFYSIRRYAFKNVNVYGNIAVFVPLGAYLLVLRKDKRVIPNLLLIFIVSFSVEVVQCLIGIGATDIDDLILNFFGGLIGVLGCKLLLCLLHDEKKVRAVVTIVSAIGLPFLLYLLFGIKLRL